MFQLFKQAFADASGVSALIAMILFFIAFVGIVFKVYRRSARAHYDHMSRLPLEGRDSK